MRLINKISRYFLLNAVIIFIFVAFLLYVIVERTVTNEVDEQLLHISSKAVNEINRGKKISFPPFIEIREIPNHFFDNGFSDVSLVTSQENEEEPFRQYASIVEINRKQFQIVTRISLIEKEDMLISVFLITITAVLFFTLIMFLINKSISRKVFKDFYNTLKSLEDFSLEKNTPLQLSKSKIDEFSKLNKSVELLSHKALTEYRSIKELTEETNHELQTPLAVIKSKLETLLQSDNLKENDLYQLNTALINLRKLERINKSILLLNKLENKSLFIESEVNLSWEIKNILKSFSDFIDSKKLSVNISLNDQIIITANSSLLNILFSNLLSNAIKHNVECGKIFVEFNNNQLIINNTAKDINNNFEKFFDRFYKESESNDSVGLGLTIAKKICELYKIDITNNFQNNTYYTILDFNKTDAIK